MVKSSYWCKAAPWQIGGGAGATRVEREREIGRERGEEEREGERKGQAVMGL